MAEFNAGLQGDSFVSLTGTETLTNKTLTSPKINEDVAVTGNQIGTIGTGTVTITADCVVIPTGSAITVQTTSAGVITWNDINLNASQTWTEVAA